MLSSTVEAVRSGSKKDVSTQQGTDKDNDRQRPPPCCYLTLQLFISHLISFNYFFVASVASVSSVVSMVSFPSLPSFYSLLSFLSFRMVFSEWLPLLRGRRGG